MKVYGLCLFGLLSAISMAAAQTSAKPADGTGTQIEKKINDLQDQIDELDSARDALLKPLPEDIVTAWKKVAEVGWLRVNSAGLLEFVGKSQGKPGDLPAFRFIVLQHDGRLAKLPVPAAAFGLSFHTQSLLTDADLKELAQLKSLQVARPYPHPGDGCGNEGTGRA